jgi:hypothetical protein
MLALVSALLAAQTAHATHGHSPTLILLIIATVVVAFCWRILIKIGLAAIVIGFAFLMISGLLDVLHGLHSLIP